MARRVEVRVKVDQRDLEREYERQFEALRAEVKKIATKHGYLIRNDVIKLAPVDTGRLRSSYLVKVEDDTPDRFTVVIGTNVTYAVHVEYGTRYTRAQPHLRPALDKNKDQFVAEIEALFGGTR